MRPRLTGLTTSGGTYPTFDLGVLAVLLEPPRREPLVADAFLDPAVEADMAGEPGACERDGPRFLFAAEDDGATNGCAEGLSFCPGGGVGDDAGSASDAFCAVASTVVSVSVTSGTEVVSAVWRG
jgi:hypothetical protein